MINTVFLTFEQILAIHDSQIEMYGGSHGIRELSLLESAVMRPQTTFAGRDLYSSLFEKTAVLTYSLIINHPFVDGNKRTGIVAALIFTEINGFKIVCSDKELLSLSLRVVSKKINLQNLADWFKKHSKKI